MIDHVNMDALSKFFDDIHLNKSEYIYIKAQGEWAFKTQDQSALLAYIVLTGSVYIQLNVSEKITARAGDIILIPSGKAHHATDSKATASKLVDPVDITPLFNGHRHDPIELGSSTSLKIPYYSACAVKSILIWQGHLLMHYPLLCIFNMRTKPLLLNGCK